MHKQAELLPLSHNPAMPLRDGVVGEAVFVEAWQKLMDSPLPLFATEDTNSWLDLVLNYSAGNVGQREATLCASIICWLGTSIGQCYLAEAKKLDSNFPAREDAYLAAWAVQNKRTFFVNSGVRTLELCLSTEVREGKVSFYRPAVDLSVADYECAEALVRWLGSSDGQKFLDYCEKEIERLKTPPTDFPQFG